MFYRFVAVAIMSICGINATASEISIKSSRGDSNRIPVVFEFKGEAAKEAASMLKSTKIFDAEFGSCNKVSSLKGQDVVCVSAIDGSGVSIDVPYQLEKELAVVESAQHLASEVYKATLNHKVAPFDAELALVTKDKATGWYSLLVTDYRGQKGKVLLSSPMPILSPSWSPDGRYLTYVSYETYRTSIFVQNVETGVRLKVYEVRGLNAYPTFKDNRTLLFSVSAEKKGSNIAEFDLLTKKLKGLVVSDKHSDVFPVKTKNETVFVRMFSDIPYLYGKTDNGGLFQLSKSPNNIPSVNADGTVLTSSFGGYIYIWDMLNKKVTKKINTSDRVESLSVSAGAQSYYYVTDKGNGYRLVSYTSYGSKMLELKDKSADIIQVSAN